MVCLEVQILVLLTQRLTPAASVSLQITGKLAFASGGWGVSVGGCNEESGQRQPVLCKRGSGWIC